MVHEYNDPGCRHMGALDLAGFLPRSAVNGPGIRAVVWVQGCPHRCEGCFNSDFQSFSSVNRIPVSELTARILALPDIDGVTFSGGEPFAQAGPLSALGDRLHAFGLSIVTYTGYTPDQIARGDDPAWPALLAVTDLLIAGPYIAALSRPDLLKGSANQQVIPLGTRFVVETRQHVAQLASHHAEFTIVPDGTITTTGFPTKALLDLTTSRPGRV